MLGPVFASASIAYGYKVWLDDEVLKWLGHRESVGLHEGHDLRISHPDVDIPWEDTTGSKPEGK